MNGRRAKHDAAHPIAAAFFLASSFVVLGITLGVVIVDWGWSWLTTVLGAVAVALAVLTAVCLIPDTDDDPEPDDDWRPGRFGYASEEVETKPDVDLEALAAEPRLRVRHAIDACDARRQRRPAVLRRSRW